MNSQSHSLAVGLPDLSIAGAPVYANVAHTTFTPYDFRPSVVRSMSAASTAG